MALKKDGKIVCACFMIRYPMMKCFHYYYAPRGILIDYENKLMADSMHLFVSNGLCHITFTMAPAASAFHLSSFTTSHIDIAVIISTITMFTSHIFLMIIVNSLRSDINTIRGYNSRHNVVHRRKAPWLPQSPTFCQP